MKTKLFAAVLAALTLMAPAASAQDFRRGVGDNDWRGGREITVRDGRRVFSIDRGDRLFHRLQESPFRFRPGFTYVYTDNCQRDGQCRVIVYAPHSRRPVHNLMAPPINARGDRWGDNDNRGRGDRDWDDRRRDND